MPSDKLRKLTAPRPQVPTSDLRKHPGRRDVPGSFSEFGGAAVEDVKEIGRGIADLPGLAVDFVKNPEEIGGQVIKGLAGHIQELVNHPIDTFLRNPVSTALDLLPAAGVAKLGAAKVLGRTYIAGEAVEATGIAAKMKRWAMGKKISKVENDVTELIRERDIAINLGRFDANEFSIKIQKQFGVERKAGLKFGDEQVLEDITHYTENTRNPLLDPPDAGVGLVEGRLKAIPGALDAAKKLKERMEISRQAVNSSGMSEYLPFIENYITHFWNIPSGKARGVAAGLAKKNQFANGRVFKDFIEGMNAKFEPTTRNAAEIVKMYESANVQVIETNRMLKNLTELEVQPGLRAIMDSKKSPKSYVYMEHPAFRNVFENTGKVDKFGKPLRRSRNVRVHPEVADVLKQVFDKPFDGNLARKVTVANAWMKASSLAFSFFHPVALIESGLSAVGLQGLRFRKGLKHLEDKSHSRFSIESGLNLGPLSDVHVGTVMKGLKNLESRLKKIPIAGQVARGLRAGKEVWDWGLWDQFHTGLKSFAFHKLVERAIKKSPGVSKKVIGREIAEFVNDAFGGQNFNLMMKSPKWQQMAHWAFLAPDWTISNLRIAMRPFDKGITGQFGRAYWARAAFAGITANSLLNYTMTKWETGEGRFLWDNDPGHKFDIALPFKDDKGRRQYIKIGKQMREPLRWISEPTKIFGAKLSPSLQIAIEQVSGSSATGFPQEFKDEDFFDSIPTRVGALADKFRPFSTQENNFAFTLPKSAGTTGFKVREGLKKALEKKDNRALAEWLRAAANNGYNPKQLLNLAKRELRGEQRREAREKAK